MKELLYKWEFSDNKQRGSLWYVIAASIALWLIIWWFLTNQYGMSFIILLISGIYFFIENNSQDIIGIQVLPEWIQVESTLYDLGSIHEAKFVFYNENPYFLRLQLTRKGLKQIDIHINQKQYSDLQTILPQLFQLWESSKLTVTEKMIILLKL